MHKHFAEDKHCREIPSNDRVWMFLSRLTLTFAFLDLQNISLFPLSVVSPGRIISSLIPQELHMINFLSKGYNDPLYGRGSFYIRISKSFSLCILYQSIVYQELDIFTSILSDTNVGTSNLLTSVPHYSKSAEERKLPLRPGVAEETSKRPFWKEALW